MCVLSAEKCLGKGAKHVINKVYNMYLFRKTYKYVKSVKSFSMEISANALKTLTD